MAIVQISRITHRKGLYENLPQLAGGELGWAQDERKLFIGNGTLADGAPVVGNTEILTEFSDLLALSSTYTYNGEVESPLDSTSKAVNTVQTGSTRTNPITRSLQAKFDDFASVKDFGAVGDGEVDDTAAINRALTELFTKQTNEEIRRSLFFPAGVYRISGTIVVPTYAKLFGEGKESSIIRYNSDDSTVDDYVVRTADSKGQTGANIATNGATRSNYIEISSMSFETVHQHNICLVEKATNTWFDSVEFKGALTAAEMIDAFENTAAITIISNTSLVTQSVTFDKCVTTNTTYGLKIDTNCQGVTLSNSYIKMHYRGIQLGESPVNNGPSGVRITQNVFDDIYADGIYIGDVTDNISAHNVFYDVGNAFNGLGNPATPVININNANNLSIGDLFERDDTDDLQYRRIELNDVGGFVIDGANRVKFGNYVQSVGLTTTLADNTSVATAIIHEVLDNDLLHGFEIKYALTRDSSSRTGKITVAPDQAGTNTPSYTDDYVEFGTTGVVLSITQVSDKLYFKYTTTSTGQTCTLNYSIIKYAS